LEHFGSRHHARSVLPDSALSHTFETETISAAKKIDTGSLIHSQHDFGRGRKKRNAMRASHPTTFDQDQTIYGRIFLAENVILAIDHVTRCAAQFFGQRIAQRFVGDSGEVFENAASAVCAISFVEDVAERLQLTQQTQRWSCYFEHNRFLISGDGDGRVAFDAGQQCHLTKAGARSELTYFLLTVV